MDWLIDYGYVGLFLGSFLAATVIPFSADVLLVVLLAAGADPYLAITLATIGNWFGGLTSYWLGRIGKWAWLEKYFGIGQEKIERQRKRIMRWGSLLAFMTWLPVIGDILAVALGFYRIGFVRSAVFMLLGKGTRFILWAVIYYLVRPLF